MAIVPALTDDLYHYTSSNIALDSIIAQMQLRLGLVELMNDPRESRPRYPNLSIAEGVPEAGPAIMEEADRLLRRAAKVACFTQDYELPDSVADRNALRGYAHPALWAHYAGGHTGVCLRFDRSALDSCMRAQLSSYGLLFEGAVEYRLELSSTAQATGLDVEQIHEFGLDAVVTRYIERYQRELFFEKHSDWASEAEYRWVFVNPEPSPVYLDVSDAITGIVLGDAFLEARLDAVHHLASRHDLDLKRVRFFNRWLHLMPVAAPPPREPPAHRREGSLEDRAQELAEAESKAEQASSLGAQLAAPIIAALWVRMQAIAEQVAKLPSVEVGIYDRATAIPLPERRRAPGVPTYSADYQRGVMCVVENLPRYSVTFVASAAVQTIGDRSLKLHAAFEVERRRKDEPNERIELWRFASEGKLEAVAKLRDRFFAEITSHLSPALATFNELRSSSPSDD
jgi:hypothetical protein